ncbi:mucin-like protein [Mercenaria mercenaria]|uniref:mucin-like protein n=1 Tax=Mercenaria mercenaria TaxID=6596 RepID=UPI00234F3F9B|nr:mucin-like protein [Mercenaria mercenaria]
MAGGGKVVIQDCAIKEFATQIIFTAGKFISLSIKVNNKYSESLNITGLAGHQKDKQFVFSNGTKVDVNSPAPVIFEYGESWTLADKTESNFNYSITKRNYTYYNEHHTRPRFLEELVGNLSALFEDYTASNISLFNTTCISDWDKKPNTQCLLAIARTGDINQGVAEMSAAKETHRIWETLHNHPPIVSESFPKTITVRYKEDLNWTIDLKNYVYDDNTGKDDLKFDVQTDLPKNEYTLDGGVFTWIIGTGLRYIDTAFSFTAYDKFNATAHFGISINYCGCKEPTQCYFDDSTDDVNKASCSCPVYAKGLYCDGIRDSCPNVTCYQDNCNATAYQSFTSWPCAPCPKGMDETMTPKMQTCKDINECLSDYTGKDKCEQLCHNSVGSFTCYCESGYKLNADKRTCDDIDECSLSPSNCTGKNEVCLNTKGNFSCICKPGYSKTHGVCEKAEGPTYVGHMDFSISVATEHVTEINKTINKPENIKTVQNQLAAGFNSTKGFLSVEVFRLSVVIYQEKRAKRGDDKNDKKYKFRADYIVHWKNETDTKTIGEELLKSFENFTRHTEQHKLPGTQSNLKIGNVVIYLNSAESRINNATEGGLCTVPDKTDCDRGSTNCIDKEHGKYECQCKSGYSPAHLNTKFCTDINECNDFKKNRTIGERCVHGSCYNSVGSWNCSCPAGRKLQNVGNTTSTVYRCQGKPSVNLFRYSSGSTFVVLCAFEKNTLA